MDSGLRPVTRTISISRRFTEYAYYCGRGTYCLIGNYNNAAVSLYYYYTFYVFFFAIHCYYDIMLTEQYTWTET